MGNYCCNCKSFSSSPVQRKIILLLVGLDNSGKTTAAKGLTGEAVEHTIPTIGFSSIKMKHKGFDVVIYDLGGGPQIRGIWSCYFSDVYGVIFVVDASDENRLEEAKILLHNLISNEKLAGKPLLVLANKQDIPNALDEIDVVELLRLEPLVNRHKCVTLVEVCSALSPDNNEKVDSRLVRGYRWLVRQVINNYSELNRRVERDMKEAQAAVLVQREEWKKRRSMNSENNLQLTTSIANSGQMANGSLPPVAETNGYAKGPSKFSDRIRDQMEMAEKHKSRKCNKVFPGLPKREMSSALNQTDHFEERSMTVRALTSPRRNHVEPIVYTSRPFTSKSLGNGEVKPWGLDQELKLIDQDIGRHEISSSVADQTRVEYFHRNAAF